MSVYIQIHLYRHMFIWKDNTNWKGLLPRANCKVDLAGPLEENVPWVKIRFDVASGGLRPERTMASGTIWHQLLGLPQFRCLKLLLAFIGEQNYNTLETIYSWNGTSINNSHTGLC